MFSSSTFPSHTPIGTRLHHVNDRPIITRIDPNGQLPRNPSADQIVNGVPQPTLVYYNEVKPYILNKYAGSSDPVGEMYALRSQIWSLEGNFHADDPEKNRVVDTVLERFRKDGAAPAIRGARRKKLLLLEAAFKATLEELDAIRKKLKDLRVRGQLYTERCEADKLLDAEQSKEEDERTDILKLENELATKRKKLALAAQKKKIEASEKQAPSSSSQFQSSSPPPKKSPAKSNERRLTLNEVGDVVSDEGQLSDE